LPLLVVERKLAFLLKHPSCRSLPNKFLR
jgi:hypothetical protein